MNTSVAENQQQGILPIPDYGGEFSSRDYLAGNWDGKRIERANKGVQLGLEYLHWFGSVVDGGLSDDTESGANLTYKLKWDLMRAGKMPSALIDIRAESRHGSNTNPHSGTLQPHVTASLAPVNYDDLQKDADFTITPATRFSVNLQHLQAFQIGVDDATVLSGRLHLPF